MGKGKNDVAKLRDRLAAAEVALTAAQGRVSQLQGQLREALEAGRALTADDYRVVIECDDGWSWSTAEAMLDDTQGDCDPLVCCGSDWRDHFASEADWQAACDAITETNARWIDAWENGPGISCYHATLYKRDALTNDWEIEDSCGGFFAIEGSGDVVDWILDQVVPQGIDRADISVDF